MHHLRTKELVSQSKLNKLERTKRITEEIFRNDKPFTCNICGGKFSRYSSLWSHKKLHSGEKNYKCDQCSSSFAKAVYLKNHMRIHSGEVRFMVNYASVNNRWWTLSSETLSMQHLRHDFQSVSTSQKPWKDSHWVRLTSSAVVHRNSPYNFSHSEKPYVCQICDKGFARHATLWNHRRIHTGLVVVDRLVTKITKILNFSRSEKPYKCERCSSAFSQAAHLKNHEKVHLGEWPSILHCAPFSSDVNILIDLHRY